MTLRGGAVGQSDVTKYPSLRKRKGGRREESERREGEGEGSERRKGSERSKEGEKCGGRGWRKQGRKEGS